MTASDDPRASLAILVVRLRAATQGERATVVAELLPLLSDTRVPLAVRLAAAARAIDALPDTAKAIRGVVRAITANLTHSRALIRLRHLQHLIEKGRALDAIVAVREQKLKMTCPRCGVRLTRAEMAKHLWHEHQLTLVKGKTRTRAGAVEAIRREYGATGDPAFIDRAVEVGGEPAVRVWAAETTSPEESLPVCSAARARGASVCPACFADVRPSIPELPPPLAIAHGRLAGDGFVATAPGTFPRIRATIAAAGVLLVVTALIHVSLGFVLAIVAYFAVLLAAVTRSSMDDRAVDTAWRKLAPRLADRSDAARFLTRLCVTSVGRGDPFVRANTLQRVIARARTNPAECPLLAASLVLQVNDAGRYGRDRVAGIAELAVMGLRGEQPLEFAEYVLAANATARCEPGEPERLRVLLLAAAFASGLTPRDVIDLCDAAPHLAETMRLSPYHLALLYGVWLNRTDCPWVAVGEAETVFELAATSPATATRFLADAPGLLLACETHPDVATELGRVLVTATGVWVGGAVSLDPAAEVRVEAGGRQLVFGKSRLQLERAIPEAFAAVLKAWLRFWAQTLAGYPATYLQSDPLPVLQAVAAFVAKCPACGVVCAPVVGAIARPLRV